MHALSPIMLMASDAFFCIWIAIASSSPALKRSLEKPPSFLSSQTKPLSVYSSLCALSIKAASRARCQTDRTLNVGRTALCVKRKGGENNVEPSNSVARSENAPFHTSTCSTGPLVDRNLPAFLNFNPFLRGTPAGNKEP